MNRTKQWKWRHEKQMIIFFIFSSNVKFTDLIFFRFLIFSCVSFHDLKTIFIMHCIISTKNIFVEFFEEFWVDQTFFASFSRTLNPKCNPVNKVDHKHVKLLRVVHYFFDISIEKYFLHCCLLVAVLVLTCVYTKEF